MTGLMIQTKIYGRFSLFSKQQPGTIETSIYSTDGAYLQHTFYI